MVDLSAPYLTFTFTFLHGLALFCLGLSVALETRRAPAELPFARPTFLLGFFGILIAAHVWMRMIMDQAGLPPLDRSTARWLEVSRLILQASGYNALLAFGLQLGFLDRLRGVGQVRFSTVLFVGWIAVTVAVGLLFHQSLLLATFDKNLIRLDHWIRYSLAVPGGLISGYALGRQARRLPAQQAPYARYLRLAAVLIVLYGAVGQIFVPRSPLFPATLLNDVLFQEVFNVPLEAVQTILALSLAIGLIAALKMFEIERQTALETAQRRARESTQRQEAMRREMLRHTVDAQEEERRRIARELHDETGQLLTALSLGLENLLRVDPDQVPAAVDDLRRLTDSATDELHRLVADLRPSQLDHLGLAAALRALAQQTRKCSGVRIELSFSGQRRRLPPEFELAIFRIVQEAVTNVVRHAQVKTAQVWIEYTDEGVLASISDDGVGYAPAGFQYNHGQEPQSGSAHWGLLGIKERVALLGGVLTIESVPGQGAHVMAWLPFALAPNPAEEPIRHE